MPYNRAYKSFLHIIEFVQCATKTESRTKTAAVVHAAKVGKAGGELAFSSKFIDELLTN